MSTSVLIGGGNPRLVVDGLRFAEGPRWRDGKLWFSDIHSHRVLTTDPAGRCEVVATLDDRPSGLGFLPDGALLVVSMLDRRVLRIEPDGNAVVHAELGAMCTDFVNDMVVDPVTGCAYVGCRNVGGGATGPRDAVLLVRPDGSACVAADGLQGPNGSVITPDGSTLIVAETPIGRLTMFPIRADGSLGEPSTYADVAGHHLDGIALDDAGMVWAGAGEAGLLRIAPPGRVVEQLTIAGRMVIACAFGGEGRRDLYLATASPALFENLRSIGADRTRDAGTDSEARIEVVPTACAGAGTP
jgi:sugar lactone lactonase YvrE